VNKVDLVDKSEALRLGEKVFGMCEEAISLHLISALKGDGVADLLEDIKKNLPEGPKFYPEDMVTDRPLAFMASEIVREKIFQNTYEEIPHSSAVIVEEIKERENGVIYIRANIYVERNSQKGILIGKGGSMIKKIGTLARKELEFLTGRKVYLDLNVKVKEKWREKDFIILHEVGMKDDLDKR